MEDNNFLCIRKRCLAVVFVLFVLECYLNFLVFYKAVHTPRKYYVNINLPSNFSEYTSTSPNETSFVLTTEKVLEYYKYPLINSSEVTMDFSTGYNSSYYWFISMKHLFKNMGDYDESRNSKVMRNCEINLSNLGPIKINKSEVTLEWVEQQNEDVELGGTHAPAHCHPKQRVAVIVPYRDRQKNLNIFLRYIHPLLKKQLLDYRIFVIEQYEGTKKFNKGMLYNIAFLETQRFGAWHCLIFHDVDLIPQDERISYSCQDQPIHLSAAVEQFNYALPYDLFGGVTALTPVQFENVNGYANLYWDWGGEDDDMRLRIVSKHYNVIRYNSSIARYASLSHPLNGEGDARQLFYTLSRLHLPNTGLSATKYKLISVTNSKLFTRILADVNPDKRKLDTKSQMQHIMKMHKDGFEFDRQILNLKPINAIAVMRHKAKQRKRLK